MELLRFTNSGTEANLMALASACAHTGRRKVLVFKGGYHGGVLAFAGGGSPVNVPHEWIVARYNDLQDVRAKVAPHQGDLAAILVEPLMGSGGCIPADPAFLQGLRALADASDRCWRAAARVRAPSSAVRTNRRRSVRSNCKRRSLGKPA